MPASLSKGRQSYDSVHHVSAGIASLAVLNLTISAAGVAAQEAPKQTVIDLSFDSIDTRVRPCPCTPNALVHNTFQVVLSNRNNVSEATSHISANKKYSRNTESSNLLGEESVNGPSWRVLSSNKLERIENYPQNVRTLIITVVNRRECILDVIDRLKPGFNEYTFFSISMKQIAYYSGMHTLNMLCSIR